MTTGITTPGCSLVLALKSLQNAMMLTPCWPSAGPTGGAGLACPAGICSLICPVIFFAMISKFLIFNRNLNLNPIHPEIRIKIKIGGSPFLHLPIFQFHGRVAPENIHRYLQFAPFGLDFLDHPAE